MLFVGFCLCGASFSRACTVFADSGGETVLAGRNWDMTPCDPVMWLVPAHGTTHGRVCFGRHAGCEDGMNDQGLFVAVAATPASGRFESGDRPMWCPVALDFVLAHCANVEQATAWWEKQTNPGINSTITRQHSFLGIPCGGRYVNSGIGGHVLMADKSGNSVVCEWVEGKFKPIRKTGRYQLMTNFLLSKPEIGGSPCPRFNGVTKILSEAGAPSLTTCATALKAASTEFTRYSVVYDLIRGDVHIYCRGRFDNKKTVHLSEELRKGGHEVDLYGWLEVRPTIPKVTGRSKLLADEILTNAINARGGTRAASEIHSFRAKGTMDLDPGPLAASPAELCASRPNMFRLLLHCRSLLDPKLGNYESGFDGQTAWEVQPGAAPEVLKGEKLKQSWDGAAFFAWYDDPRDFQSAKCLGESVFDGHNCYAMRLRTASGRWVTHYYDSSSFLLIGSTELIESGTGRVLNKSHFSGYRAFNGFLFPTLLEEESQENRSVLRVDSVEVNTVETSSLKMPTKTPAEAN